MSISPHFLTSDVELGYITPGHGAHGKQLWISDVTDIEDMCNEYLCQQQTR